MQHVEHLVAEGLLLAHLHRLGAARRLVNTTDRMFTLATSPGRFATFVRTQIVPRVMPLLVRIPAVPRFMFRTVSQTMITYCYGPLGSGTAGQAPT
jgi:hypothetical protein